MDRPVIMFAAKRRLVGQPQFIYVFKLKMDHSFVKDLCVMSWFWDFRDSGGIDWSAVLPADI